MKNNDFLNLNFLSKYYIKRREAKLKRLDHRKDELYLRIEKERLALDRNKQDIKKLQEENTGLKLQYDNLKKLIFQRGIIIDIENTSFSINQWESLNLHQKSNSYIITSKKGEELYCFDKDYSMFLDDVLKSVSSYSLVAIRVSSGSIKVQLRFN